MTVINTNVNSLMAQNAISKNSRSLNDAMDQLSTGKRINSAADDAAGLAISNRMTSQIKGLDQAVRNASDGIALLQTAEGATIEITDMLQRMRELAVQSSNDTYTDAERTYLNLEFQQLNAEMTRIASNTQWNGMEILDGVNNSFNFQVGANANQTIDIDISDLRNLLPTEATAQVGTFAVGNDLAGGANATVTVNGTTYTITGTVSAGQVETGNYAVNNALGAGEVATLTLGGETFTVSGDAATAQQATATLNPGASFASTDTMSVTVNGQSFVVYGQQHTATTGREAAAALASAINTASDVAKVVKYDMGFSAGSRATASSQFTVTVNGQVYQVNGDEHNATTASGVALALASKINENPLARVAKVTIDDSNVAAGNVLSLEVNGNTYFLGSAAADAYETMSQLVSVINGAAVAQVDTVLMTNINAGQSARVTVNGSDYTLVSAATANYTAAQTASVLAGKINGSDIAQVEHLSMGNHSVNMNMNLQMAVNGTNYSVAALDHVAVTQASGMALLAAEINAGQTAVSAIVSGDVMILRAAVAGTGFSTGNLSVGAQAVKTTTLVVANNTAQTAVSATTSAGYVKLTALTAGSGFSTAGTNNGVAATQATATYNNVAADGFSASLSGAPLNHTVTMQAKTGTNAASAYTLEINGVSISFGNGTATRTQAQLATSAKQAISSDAATAALLSAAVDGNNLVLTAKEAGRGFSVGSAYIANTGGVAASYTAVTTFSSQQDVSLILTATTAGTTFSNGTALNLNGAASAALSETRPNAVGQTAVTATVSGDYLVVTGTAGVDFSATAASVLNFQELLIAASTGTGLAGVSITVNGQAYGIDAFTMSNTGGYAAFTSAVVASVLAGQINGAAEKRQVATGVSNIAIGASVRVSVAGTVVAIAGSTATMTSAVVATALASAINQNATLSSRVSATTSIAGGNTFVVVTALVAGYDEGLSQLSKIGVVQTSALGGGGSYTDLTTTARQTNAIGRLATTGVSAVVSSTDYIRLAGTSLGNTFSAASFRLGTASQAITTSVAVGLTGSLSTYQGVIAAQTAVSATTSGAAVILTATDAGTAFSAGSFTLNTTAFATATTVANDAGGNTAAEVATDLAALAAASLSDLSVGASGAAITVAGTVNGTAVTAGDLSDGTSTISYTQTQASRVDVSGNTAASVATLLVSAVNAGESTVGAVVSGAAMVLTATTAGVGFTASTLNDGTDTASYTAVTANAALQAISSEAGAQSAISLIDNVLDTVNLERANLGAVMNRLEYAMDNLANVSMNISDSRSRIEDADYAKATTELARTQIIQQAATSMLAQANQQPQMVLSLLQ